MTSFYPQPATKLFDYVAEVVSHLATCKADCPHVRELQDKFGVFTVALAIDRINAQRD